MNSYKPTEMSFKIISISLPSKDHLALKSHLSQVGMTRSEYVRSLLRKDREKYRKAKGAK